MGEEDTWRNTGVVRFIGFTDTIIGIFFVIFYLIGGVGFNTRVVDIQNELFSPFIVYTLSFLVWAFVFSITAFHTRAAYLLFLVTYQDALGPEVATARAKHWIKVTFAVFLLVLLKVVYLATRRESPSPVLWIMCILHVMFRIFALYFVIEFIDDVIHQIRIAKQQGQNLKDKTMHCRSSNDSLGTPLNNALRAIAVKS